MSGCEPIIVIGAHRSGTSAVARVLETLGVFMGRQLDPNHEARFFLELDEWILRQCGARWDNPEAVAHLLEDRRQRELVTRHLANSVASLRAVRYLGWSRWLRGQRLHRLARPWGFKDPRATFTLPLWLDVFPGARVVHVHRHGVDVARSLCARHGAHLAASERRFARNRRLLSLLPKRAGFGDSPRLSTLEGGLGLWESYVRTARYAVTRSGPRALELRYEDLAIDPHTIVGRLAAFCGLEIDAERIAAAAAPIASDRAGAHLHDPALAAFAERVAARVAALRDGSVVAPAQPTVRSVLP